MTRDGRPGEAPTGVVKPQVQDYLVSKPAIDPRRRRAHPRAEGPLLSSDYQGDTPVRKAECLVYEGVSAKHTLMVVREEKEDAR